MSILIKGMEMPQSCNECLLSMETACGLSGKIVPDYWGRDDRPSWCELIELPPHGRLIDVDAFSEFVRKTWADCDQWILGYLEACNTIIGADTCNNSRETCNKADNDKVNANIGKWIDKWYCSNMSGYEYAMNCSACGKPTYRISLVEPMPPYCPNCGARMDDPT